MKFGVKSFLMVGLMSVLFIVMAKVVVNKFDKTPAGIKSVVNAV